MDKYSGIFELSSDDRIKGENGDNGDAVFYMNIPDFATDAIGCSAYNVLYSIQNINVNNNTAVFETATQSYPVLLDNGYYNYEELRAEIETVLNTLGLGAFVVALVDYKYTITAPVPIKFVENPASTYKYDWASMINLPKNAGLSVGIIGGFADISYTNKLIFTCDELHSSKSIGDYTTSENAGNILCVAYINANKNYNDADIDKLIQPHNVSLDLHNIKWILKRTSQSIYRTRIRVLDSRGYPIPKESDGCGTVKWDLQVRLKGTK